MEPTLQHPDSDDAYLSGECHVLAVALHRQWGWSIVLVLDPHECFWEDPTDSENCIPAVVHAYAVDPQHRAWDIHGVRPAERIREDVCERFVLSEADTDWVQDEHGLRMYVGEWGEPEPIDRPLAAYTEQDIAGAWAAAERRLSELPEWPVPPRASRKASP